jgi:hypothetical protein
MSSPANPGTQESTIPMGLRILAIVLRALFLGALVAITVRLSRPQSETIWSVYETPGDLIRLMLGVAVCLWIVLHLFMLIGAGSTSALWSRRWHGRSPSPSGDRGLAMSLSGRSGNKRRQPRPPQRAQPLPQRNN